MRSATAGDAASVNKAPIEAIEKIAINIHLSTVHHHRPIKLVSVLGRVVMCESPDGTLEVHQQNHEKHFHGTQNFQIDQKMHMPVKATRQSLHQS